MSKEPYKSEEKDIMNLIVEAHNRFTQLEQTHPDEIKEWVNGIHQLQNVLGWRILRRDYPQDFKSFTRDSEIVLDTSSSVTVRKV